MEHGGAVFAPVRPRPRTQSKTRRVGNMFATRRRLSAISSRKIGRRSIIVFRDLRIQRGYRGHDADERHPMAVMEHAVRRPASKIRELPVFAGANQLRFYERLALRRPVATIGAPSQPGESARIAVCIWIPEAGLGSRAPGFWSVLYTVAPIGWCAPATSAWPWSRGVLPRWRARS